MHVTSIDEDDPFQDIDAGLELGGLISSLDADNHCSTDEFINGGNDIPTCLEVGEEN